MISSEININCDYKGCNEHQWNDNWDISCEEFIAKLFEKDWGFPVEFDVNLSDNIIYCPLHFKVCRETNNDNEFDVKEWSIVKKRLTCNEHKIPDCDMHQKIAN